MASAGQTSAQVGDSQCMQTTGTVCVDCGAVDVLEVDHRLPRVRVALGAGLHARLAADAAVRVDEELQVVRVGHGDPSRLLLRLELRGVVRRAVRLARRGTAQTLYCGIFEIGSCAAIVSWLTLFGPAQW